MSVEFNYPKFVLIKRTQVGVCIFNVLLTTVLAFVACNLANVDVDNLDPVPKYSSLIKVNLSDFNLCTFLKSHFDVLFIVAHSSNHSLLYLAFHSREHRGNLRQCSRAQVFGLLLLYSRRGHLHS